jgi:hypothetical protein
MVRITEENRLVEIPPRERNSIQEKEAVLAEVQLRFYRSPYQELRDITCDFQEGVLTLRGRVPSYFLKQIAQSIIFSMERIGEIRNRLEISDS